MIENRYINSEGEEEYTYVFDNEEPVRKIHLKIVCDKKIFNQLFEEYFKLVLNKEFGDY